MHPKNPFAEDYDFDLLVEKHPILKEFVFVNKYGNKTIKFGDQAAVKALNAALLKSNYGIDWNIPKDYLCPPIPGRLDYLLHVADLIPKKDIRLLDIGTGANLIYPILGTCHFTWTCTASEVDPTAIQNAQKIIDNNPALGKIELRIQKYRRNILSGIIQKGDAFDVVICNPPFYKSLEDAQKENLRKVRNLKLKEKNKLNFGGLPNELWFTGGEEAFIQIMAKESVRFRRQVQWFTALISRKENIPTIKRSVNEINPSKVKIIDMELGNKTSRFIAWSFV